MRCWFLEEQHVVILPHKRGTVVSLKQGLHTLSSSMNTWWTIYSKVPQYLCKILIKYYTIKLYPPPFYVTCVNILSAVCAKVWPLLSHCCNYHYLLQEIFSIGEPGKKEKAIWFHRVDIQRNGNRASMYSSSARKFCFFFFLIFCLIYIWV